MGRKKYMLEGTQRGRNELIQDSIYRDTGIRRDRKQVSSHLQVLKDRLRGVPAGECPSRTSCNDRISLFSFAHNIGATVPHASIQFQVVRAFLSSKVLLEGSGGGFAVAIPGVIGRVPLGTTKMRLTCTTVLLYMATPEDVSKRRSTNTSARSSYSSQLHGRQHAQRTESVTKSDSSTSSPHVLPHCSGPQSDLALGSGPDSDALSSSFAVTGFKILLEGDHQPMHCLAQ